MIILIIDIYSITVFILENNSRHANNSKRGIVCPLFGTSRHFAVRNDVTTEQLKITRM